MIKFFYNGIKTSDFNGLQKCHYSKPGRGGYVTAAIPKDTITIYKRDYTDFSAEVRAAFAIENNTDIMTDYFEKDRIRVLPSHPLYDAVLKAWASQDAKAAARSAKRAQAHAQA